MSLKILQAERYVVVLEFEYTNDERMEYFKKQIDENVGPMNNKTNVKGGMTEYDFFLKDSTFMNFFDKEFFVPEIQKYQQAFTLPNLQGIANIRDAWGNKLEKTNEVVSHDHRCQWSSILYFCDSAPLKTEAGEFETFKGKIITLNGWVQHWVEPVDKERYSLVWNWDNNFYWNVSKKKGK